MFKLLMNVGSVQGATMIMGIGHRFVGFAVVQGLGVSLQSSSPLLGYLLAPFVFLKFSLVQKSIDLSL